MPIKRVSTTKAGASGRATSANKTEKAKATAATAAPAAAKKTKEASSKFAGTTKEAAQKPAAQLPRSGWTSGTAFAEAAKQSRQLAGLQAGGLGDRPVIRPLYGIVFPMPLDPNLKDADLEKIAKDALGDRTISLDEVNNLIGIAKQNGGLTKTDKSDLKRLMSGFGQYFQADALKTLQQFVSNNKPQPDPVIRPLYGLNFPIPVPADIKDKPLADALRADLEKRHITLDDVNNLITIANKNGGLSREERADLNRVYDELGTFMDPDAKLKLGQAIGREPVIRPLYGLQFPIPTPDLGDQKLEDALKAAMGDRRITLDEAKTLMDTAKMNGGLTVTERADLQKILDADGPFFDADAKTALTAFLAQPNGDGLKVSTDRRDQILNKMESSNLEWKTGMPLGERFVEVPLKHELGNDTFTYTALVPVGALAPNAPTSDPNDAKDMWIRRTGGFAGITEYAQLHVD
jgi:hypothetical protein